ncbi:hypothetical protein VNO77_42163 [Canavalia gladiata]|uniref:Uncharacterized protein n=1 Tax=Canavalia gladiata TaxID=3824 RepID=A0AAN9K1U8_CANGL
MGKVRPFQCTWAMLTGPTPALHLSPLCMSLLKLEDPFHAEMPISQVLLLQTYYSVIPPGITFIPLKKRGLRALDKFELWGACLGLASNSLQLILQASPIETIAHLTKTHEGDISLKLNLGSLSWLVCKEDRDCYKENFRLNIKPDVYYSTPMINGSSARTKIGQSFLCFVKTEEILQESWISKMLVKVRLLVPFVQVKSDCQFGEIRLILILPEPEEFS